MVSLGEQSCCPWFSCSFNSRSAKRNHSIWCTKPHGFSFPFFFLFSFVSWFLPPGNLSFIFQIYRGKVRQLPRHNSTTAWLFSCMRDLRRCLWESQDLHQEDEKHAVLTKCKVTWALGSGSSDFMSSLDFCQGHKLLPELVKVTMRSTQFSQWGAEGCKNKIHL